MRSILAKSARPLPFEPSEAPFWDDPHIASVLLANHLDDSHEQASRPRAFIRDSVDHFAAIGALWPGCRVLDLGCGPGLVAAEMAKVGAKVTGIDLSAGSIDYARTQAELAGQEINYRVQDFLTLDEHSEYDLVLQSYGELSTFAPTARDELLARIHRALVPGGALVFDVSTPAIRELAVRDWQVEAAGLWRRGPHLVLSETFRYPENLVSEQYLVLDEKGTTAYRMWFQDYTPETIQPLLARAEFTIEAHHGSLTGIPYENSPWLAILARRA